MNKAQTCGDSRSHFTLAVKEFLNQMFNERWMGKESLVHGLPEVPI